MILFKETTSTNNCSDLSFSTSYIRDNTIQTNFRRGEHSFDEGVEFSEIMQSIANQFDEAFRKLAN